MTQDVLTKYFHFPQSSALEVVQSFAQFQQLKVDIHIDHQ